MHTISRNLTQKIFFFFCYGNLNKVSFIKSNKYKTNSFDIELKIFFNFSPSNLKHNKSQRKILVVFDQKWPDLTNFGVKNFCLVEQHIIILKRKDFPEFWLYTDVNFDNDYASRTMENREWEVSFNEH